ncbi:hypothetical protein WAI453_011461 [Rhynchosporium graminicola]
MKHDDIFEVLLTVDFLGEQDSKDFEGNTSKHANSLIRMTLRAFNFPGSKYRSVNGYWQNILRDARQQSPAPPHLRRVYGLQRSVSDHDGIPLSDHGSGRFLVKILRLLSTRTHLKMTPLRGMGYGWKPDIVYDPISSIANLYSKIYRERLSVSSTVPI